MPAHAVPAAVAAAPRQKPSTKRCAFRNWVTPKEPGPCSRALLSPDRRCSINRSLPRLMGGVEVVVEEAGRRSHRVRGSPQRTTRSASVTWDLTTWRKRRRSSAKRSRSIPIWWAPERPWLQSNVETVVRLASWRKRRVCSNRIQRRPHAQSLGHRHCCAFGIPMKRVSRSSSNSKEPRMAFIPVPISCAQSDLWRVELPAGGGLSWPRPRLPLKGAGPPGRWAHRAGSSLFWPAGSAGCF